MGLISQAALAGYILEETLAHLIRNNGYRLINGASEDPDALTQAGHGLLVRGRGASHQADVLGELNLPSPFALPVRLFVEAKHRTEKSDLRDVRNAHGVISDVNEHYATVPAKTYLQPLRRFQYRYALFSTSGFRSAAQTFALAQQISLIDLSGPAFRPLRNTVDTAARALRAQAVSAELDNFPIRQMRMSLRRALGNEEAVDAEVSEFGTRLSPTGLLPDVLDRWSASVASDLVRTGIADSGLLLGFPPAPFVLVMRPDSRSDLERYIEQYGSEVRVDIRFDRRNMPAGDWTITPQSHPDAFALRFGLPGALERWLLTAPDVRRRAMQAKRELLSSISVFLNGRLIRLIFRPVDSASPDPQPETDSLRDEEFEPEATDASDNSELRETLRRASSERIDAWPGLLETDDFDGEVPPRSAPRAPRTLIRRRKDGQRSLEAAWTVDAARELMHRLDLGRYPQAKVLWAAAVAGGTIGRQRVLLLMDRPVDGSLNGITKPTTRMATSLKRERLLPQLAKNPLKPRYSHGVAAEFEVPLDLVAALRHLLSLN